MLLAITLHVLSFPSPNLGWTGFVCLVPLFFLAANGSRKRSFFCYFLFSFFSYLLLLYWIPRVMVKYGNTSIFLGIVGVVALSAFFSLFSGAAGMAIHSRPSFSFSHALLASAIWVSRDFFIERVFSGFPWCSLGYSQHGNLWFAQWAEIGGIHLITFLVFMINGLVYWLLIKREKRRVLVLIGTFAFLELGGLLLLQKTEKQTRPLAFHRAGIIQPNVNHDIRFGFYSAREKLRQLFVESTRLKSLGCEFVVWPEYTVPLYPLQDHPLLRQFSEFTQTQLPLFAGFTDLQGDRKTYNAIILFDRGRTDQYNKTHLTPFGEYVLFRNLLFFVRKITDEIGDFTPGETVRNLPLNGHQHATPICYEIIYPELVREFIRKSGEVIITISNDSWFGQTAAPYQHLCMARFRAIENRRYILRSTSNGISALISPTGRVIRRSPLAAEDSIIADFRYLTDRTFFTNWGYRFPYLCLIILALVVIRSFWLSPRKRA